MGVEGEDKVGGRIYKLIIAAMRLKNFISLIKSLAAIVCII